MGAGQTGAALSSHFSLPGVSAHTWVGRDEDHTQWPPVGPETAKRDIYSWNEILNFEHYLGWAS